MSIHKIDNLFTDSQISVIKKVLDTTEINNDTTLGRVVGTMHVEINEIIGTLLQVVNDISDKRLSLSSMSYAYYDGTYGEPNLPPHIDRDTIDLIIDYQLESNISWDLGINTELYSVKDNNAIAFNPNTNIHWRPHRRFEEGEYVKMLFFRFVGLDVVSDYYNMEIDESLLDQVKTLRDSGL